LGINRLETSHSLQSEKLRKGNIILKEKIHGDAITLDRIVEGKSRLAGEKGKAEERGRAKRGGTEGAAETERDADRAVLVRVYGKKSSVIALKTSTYREVKNSFQGLSKITNGSKKHGTKKGLREGRTQTRNRPGEN